MELRPEQAPGGPVITGFSGRGFRVGETVYESGLMIAPDGARAWAAPGEVSALSFAMLADLLAGDPPPEFLLLGTGTQLVRPAPSLVREIEALGIGVEAMDSRAAARAWGVLRQEERRLVGAFFPL